MKPDNTLPEDYFNDVYQENIDPWDFEKSEYEFNKYTATVNALPQQVYNNGFEIGCSIGVLSKMLAEKCKRLLSVDIADAPLEIARKRLQENPVVTFKKMAVPGEFPEDNFDLIVMSEVGYYFSLTDLDVLKEKIIHHLTPGANLILVHWTPDVYDFPLTGDIVHEEFLKSCGDGMPLKHLQSQNADTYRLDLFSKK